MKNTGNIWLLVGRETEGNNIKNYILMDYNGCTQFVQKRSIAKFCKEHEVINVQLSGDSITGKGIAITALPRYVKQQGFGLQQVSGVSQAEVIQMAQPLINQYMQKKDAELRKKQEDSTEAQKDKQNNYVLNKLSVIENLINIALNMKDITNELASNGQFTRYIKQIDIDNAEGDSLTNLIQRQGVNGLANGLLNRLDRLKDRIHKQGLNKAFISQADELKTKCEEIKKLHSETKSIIKNSRTNEAEQDKLLSKQITEVDDIPVIEDSSDMIQVDYEDTIPIVDDIGAGDIEIDQNDIVKLDSIHDIFKQEQPSKEDKETQNKIDELCDLYSKAVTNIGNIIHNTKRIAEIAHDIDMEYPGVHNRITKDKINSHYNSEEDAIKDILDHYDYIIAEENRGKLWGNLLTNYLGKVGNKIYNMTFRITNYPDNDRLNKLIELFDYYMDTLLKSITDKLSEDKEQCIQKALQNFTKLSSSKREQMLEEIFGDSWYNAGNSLEEYGSEGWAGWTADDERRKAREDTLAQYAGLSDEEFAQKLNEVKLEKEIEKRAKLVVDAFSEEIHNIYLANHGISFGESFKISNYDRGQSKHREKLRIAAELLRTTKSDYMNLSYKEFELAMTELKLQFESNIIMHIQSMIDDILLKIDNLTVADVENNTYRQIYDDIKSVERYSRDAEREYGVYLFDSNPLDNARLSHKISDKVERFKKEIEDAKKRNRRNNLSISELFDFS